MRDVSPTRDPSGPTLRRFMRDTSPQAFSPRVSQNNLRRADSQTRMSTQSLQTFNLSKKALACYRTVFDRFDSTGAGHLLPADLRSLFASLGINMDRKEIFQILCDFDQDEKGFLDFNDFLRTLTDKKVAYKLPDPPTERQIFRDCSDQGRITCESLAKAYAQQGFVVGKEEVQEIFGCLMDSLDTKSDHPDGIELPQFQKLLISCHQELGLKLKEELAKI